MEPRPTTAKTKERKIYGNPSQSVAEANQIMLITFVRIRANKTTTALVKTHKHEKLDQSPIHDKAYESEDYSVTLNVDAIEK